MVGGALRSGVHKQALLDETFKGTHVYWRLHEADEQDLEKLEGVPDSVG